MARLVGSGLILACRQMLRPLEPRLAPSLIPATVTAARTFSSTVTSAPLEMTHEQKLAERVLDKEVNRLLYYEPNRLKGKQMYAEWKIKKVPMRKWAKWRTHWGAIVLTKKHNQAHQVYDGKYK
eukprot:CAMPEP_0206435360 /NCGR_PEP_ID=MMETSP0324_2-20121206/9792_1 /ASSEMBLY_ACC=CAM_ASM_000836 /TAXON_ID=2866 /ORGANISM="Crypthecodinium cohnii, Strain Seligo" /LENGTH=123 /DNA_ID=CAMNT_0053902221 /DNA_START=41 /DNA_END=412 /DNA_ORIENTATION=-